MLKLKMLWLYGIRDIRSWYQDVWLKEEGARMCCDGYMCGCMGSCNGDMWEHIWKNRKAMRS